MNENLNQAQFDKKFKDIAIGEMANQKLGEHLNSFAEAAPRATNISISCNHCGEDIENVNALYHPGENAMHFRCPHCNKTDQSSNWHDFHTAGRMRNSFTGEVITPQNLDKHLSKPDPSAPPAPSWKEVTSKKWQEDGEPDW